MIDPIIRHGDGATEAADPRDLTVAELGDLGFAKTALRKVIRAKCLNCCCYQAIEVKRCTAVKCPLWPYRMGTNPFHTHERGFSGNRVANKDSDQEGAF